MKKFLLPMLLALAILLPTMQAQAADVPEFLSVVGNYAEYVGGQNINDKNGVYTTYSYDCDDISFAEDLVVEYCQYLISNYPFAFAGGYENDYTRTSAEKFEVALFNYTGNKYVASFISKDHKRKIQYTCNVRVFTHAQYRTGVMRITIGVANGLTYGGD